MRHTPYAQLLLPARFGLAWSPIKMGHILGASEDTTVCHWHVYALHRRYDYVS